MPPETESVAVVDHDGEVLSKTHPARARKLLDTGRASVLSTDPFVIKLARNQEDKMVQTPVITNFTEYFRTERDVYIQNKSNTQVSMQFEVSPGRTESVLIPRDKKPLNLTQIVPFHALKGSIDLRKMVNRTPPVLKLLSQEEYEAYFQTVADQAKKTPEEVIVEAQQYQRDLQDKKTFTEPSPRGRKTLDEMAEERKDEPADPQDKVSARIVGICNEVGDDIDEKRRMAAAPMLEEIKDLDAGTPLTRADLEYLQGHGYYKSVKNWALKLHSERWS